MLTESLKTEALIGEIESRGYLCIDTSNLTRKEYLFLTLLNFKGNIEILNKYDYENNNIEKVEVTFHKRKIGDKNMDLSQILPVLFSYIKKYEFLHVPLCFGNNFINQCKYEESITFVFQNNMF